MSEADRAYFESSSDYELCALYCDYHEWLAKDQGISPVVRGKYSSKLRDILLTIARRYKEAI